MSRYRRRHVHSSVSSPKGKEPAKLEPRHPTPRSELKAMDREKAVPVSPRRSPQTPPPETSPSKRLKSSPPDISYSKCKDNVNGSQAVDSESQSCGICLSEDGKAIRGWIDSCNHFFCFVCIMEWAKVESRCPMCKRRFTTIRRPPRDGLFLSDRVVNIPLRDQVYHYYGNATLGPPDPYSEVQCTVCNSSADEGLLLLCDLCDSAAHTFCVGLGVTVPEGDWFCPDCTVSKAEHEKSEIDADCDNQTSFKNILARPSTEAHVSIFDIVRESSFAEVDRPFTRASSHLNELSSPSVSERNPADRITEQSSRTHPAAAPAATEFSARTLRRCRDVRGRVQALRENWNALRSGSLGFSSSFVGCDDANKRRGNGEPRSTPCPSQQLAAEDGSSFDRIPNRSLYDVDKAWRMMDAAMSVEKAHGKAKTVRQASKLSITSALKANASSNIPASSSRSLGWRNHANDGAQKDYQYHSDAKDNEKHKSEIIVKQKQIITSIGRTPKCGANSHSPRSLGKHELPSSRKFQPLINGKLREDVTSPSNVCNENYGSVHLTSPSGSVTAASSTSCAKLGVELPNGKAGMKKCGSNSSRDDDTKSEIQSLVKLNLKLLDRDKNLGVDAFKEIARLATHSILAACGKSDPKPGVRSFSGTICRHYTNRTEQLRLSTLMPTSCRECFYVFVKDVVNTIMVEKIGRTSKSSS